MNQGLAASMDLPGRELRMTAAWHPISMRISKFLHSCLLVEKDGSRILFDPGNFSFLEGTVKPEQFEGLAAVMLTHGHPDHADLAAISRIMTVNPSAEIVTNEQTAALLTEKGLQTTVFEAGKRQIAGFNVHAYPAQHAPILNLDPPQNTAYLLNEIFLNPGDSFSEDWPG